MREFISLIKDKRGFIVRFLIVLMILIYIPMALNIYYIYNKTLKAVEDEKLKDFEQILKKTSESINYALTNLETDIYKITEQDGIKKGLEDFHRLKYNYQERIEEFIRIRAEEVKDENYIVDSIICITTNGRVLDFGNNVLINVKEFFNSILYKKILAADKPIWEYLDASKIFKKPNPLYKLILASPILSIDEQKIVGYLFIILDEEILKDMYSDITIGDTGILDIYIRDERLFSKDFNDNLFNEEFNNLVESKTFNEMKKVHNQGEEYYIGVSELLPEGWHVYTLVPAIELTEFVEKQLYGSLRIISIVGALFGLCIIVLLIALTKTITEKEMAHYRLILSEDMNSKLREYKHDFINHLQVIRGLIELNRTDKALEYLQSTTKEGLKITNKFEIGIPELESAIYSAINECEKHDIKVKVESMRLPQKLPIDVYDLTKILSNLIKNAVQALMEADSKEKILSIKIYEELDEYVFKISNNTPIIPENIKGDIFKKGFSTKAGRGRGYGLYIVKKIVERNNGSLELKVDERGNHFIVRIPIV